MCTLMIDNQPRLIAWTGEPSQEKKKVKPSAKKRRAAKAKLAAASAPASEMQEVEISPLFSGFRIPVRFDETASKRSRHEWGHKENRSNARGRHIRNAFKPSGELPRH